MTSLFKENEMKCTEKPESDCCNEDMKKCETCGGYMWCSCQRPELRARVKQAWKESNNQPGGGVVHELNQPVTLAKACLPA